MSGPHVLKWAFTLEEKRGVFTAFYYCPVCRLGCHVTKVPPPDEQDTSETIRADVPCYFSLQQAQPANIRHAEAVTLAYDTLMNAMQAGGRDALIAAGLVLKHTE